MNGKEGNFDEPATFDNTEEYIDDFMAKNDNVHMPEDNANMNAQKSDVDNVSMEVNEDGNEENEIIPNNDVLFQGKQFKSFEEFQLAKSEYEKKHFFFFTTRTSAPYKGDILDKNLFREC